MMNITRRRRSGERALLTLLLCLFVSHSHSFRSPFVVDARKMRRPLVPPLCMTTSTTSTTTASTSTSTTTKTHVDLKHVEFSSSFNQDATATTTPPAAAPPVVLLHGLLGNKRNFATVATSLCQQLERKRRIVGVDLRNHGDNHHDWRDDMDYRSMAHDVVAFLDSQSDMDKVVLVGHSMGGKVAQAVALLYPNRVDGLVVLDIAPVTYDSHEDSSWKAVQEIIQVLQSVPLLDDGDGNSNTMTTKRHVDQYLRTSIPDPALRAFCLTNLHNDNNNGGGLAWKIPMHAIANQLNELASFDIGDDINNNNNNKQYHGDVFIIHGGQSSFVRHRHIATIAQYFPNHLLTTIKGAGHWIHAEAPDDTTALLKRFLDR